MSTIIQITCIYEQVKKKENKITNSANASLDKTLQRNEVFSLHSHISVSIMIHSRSKFTYLVGDWPLK